MRAEPQPARTRIARQYLSLVQTAPWKGGPERRVAETVEDWTIRTAFRRYVHAALLLGLLLVGGIDLLIGGAYALSRASLLISVLRVGIYVAAPLAILAWCYALVRRRRWEPAAGAAAFVLSLLAGYVWLPLAQPFLELARPYPLLEPLIVGLVNLAVLAATRATRAAEPAESGSAAPTFWRAAAALAALLLAVSLVGWGAASGEQRHFRSYMINPYTLHVQLDIISLREGRFFWRMYDIRYSQPTAFREQLTGGLLDAIQLHRLAPLKLETAIGGYQYQLIRNRRDLAFDLFAPFWSVAAMAGVICAACLAISWLVGKS